MNPARKVDAVLESALQEVRADGIAIGVAIEGATVFGAAGIVDGMVVDCDTVMYAASVAKQFTGFLVAQAVESGLVREDDPLSRWLPELPEWMADIRLRHLLHHTSGLSDDSRSRPSNPPGQRFAYNNAGYVLLAEVVSRALGRPVDVLAEERIFRRLAMTNTRLSSVAPRRTAEPAPPGTVGDGGLWTTVQDLVTWLDALNCGRPEPAAVRRLEVPGYLDDGTPLSYAWGVRVAATPHGRRITHGGTWAGWLAKTVRLPERRIAVAVLSTGGEENEISTLGTDLADQIARDGTNCPI